MMKDPHCGALDQMAISAVRSGDSEAIAQVAAMAGVTPGALVAAIGHDFDDEADQPAEETDPKVIPIDDATPANLDPVCLPAWAADHAMALSNAKEVSPTMAVLLTLPVLSSAVQGRYVVQIEPGYREPLCIYASPAMESGERKTAIHNPIMRPLYDLQKQRRQQAAKDIEADKIRRELAAEKVKQLKAKFSRAEGEDAEALQEQIVAAMQAMPPEISEPQTIVEDFTEAALSQALKANGESLLVASDEGGLFDNLAGRHNDQAEIDLFLKSHTGSPVVINRVGRPNIFLDRPLLSVAISPQPSVIAKLGSKPGFIERGLTARFLWGLPQSRVGSRRLSPATIDHHIIDTYRDNVARLVQVGSARDGEPSIITLDEVAYDFWKIFERWLEPRMGPKGDLRQIKAWASKLPGAVARIAAVCHCATHFEDAGTIPVSEEQMELAINLGRMLIPHAVAVHRLMGSGGATVAAEVVKHYEAAGWPIVAQSLTSWWRPVRKLCGDSSKSFAPVAEKLVDHGYLIPCDPPDGRRGGPAGQWFRANRRLQNRAGS